MLPTAVFGSRTKKICMVVLVSVSAVFLFIQVTLTNVNVRASLNQITRFRFLENLETKITFEDPPCLDRLATRYNRVEDIFCLNLPKFLPELKNPCFYEYVLNNQRRLRCLPYFYIIGMDKSGSTDLHGRLAKHPWVYGNLGSMDKETQFWSWNRYGFMNKRKGELKATLDMYMDLFSHTAEIIDSHNDTNIITGDATPMDLWDFRGWPMIPQNQGLEEPWILTPHFLRYLHKGVPKLLIQFREPVERLYSDYIFLNYGKDPIEFHKHALQAIDMMHSCFRNHSRRYCYFDDQLYQKLPARIHLGCYSMFLKEWFQVFPRSAFHITRTSEYTNNMAETLTNVFKFLEIPSVSDELMADILNQTRRHVTSLKHGVVLPETRAALRGFYEDCNQETAALLEDDRFLWLDHYS